MRLHRVGMREEKSMAERVCGESRQRRGEVGGRREGAWYCSRRPRSCNLHLLLLHVSRLQCLVQNEVLMSSSLPFQDQTQPEQLLRVGGESRSKAGEKVSDKARRATGPCRRCSDAHNGRPDCCLHTPPTNFLRYELLLNTCGVSLAGWDLGGEGGKMALRRGTAGTCFIQQAREGS